MNAAKYLLVALLVSQLCFSVWTQQLNISAIDLTGKPVENAQVSITYQKASQVSETDGLLEGQTNQYGYFYGTITNRVPAAFASGNIQVRISTGYWPGETRKLQANESSVLQPKFVVPVSLQVVYVKALSSRMEIVQGAQVVISGKLPFTRTTGTDGMARFFLPSGSNFSGFVSFSNVSRSFSSGDIVAQADGKNLITVALPPLQGEIAGSVAGEGQNSVDLRFLAINGTPLSNHQVGFSTRKGSYVLFTDQDGVAEFLSNGTGLLNVTIREYEYNYNYSMNLSAGNSSATITLSPLLNVSFYQLQDETNCFRLYANVTDPRPLQPRVFMFEYLQPKTATQLPVNATGQGAYYSRLCINASIPVRVSVSNRYEALDEYLNLTFTRPVSPAAPKPFNQSKSSSSAQPKQSGDDMVVVAIVIGITCLLSAFFARAYLSRSSRFMIEYVRHLHDEIQKRRRKKPAIPPVVPQQGQQMEDEPPPLPPA